MKSTTSKYWSSRVTRESNVLDLDAWKETFDSDPIDRKRSGVRRYRILRPVDNSLHVMIWLEFDTAREAATTLAALRQLWGNVVGKLIESPIAHIVEVVEANEL